MAYDPTIEALVRDVFAGLDPQENDAALDIVNWRTERRQGETVLTHAVVREPVLFPHDMPQYRVVRLNVGGQYEVSVWPEEGDAHGL